MRASRKSTRAKVEPETVESDENMTTAVEEHTEAVDATPEASEETTKRVRAPIETGAVVIEPSEDQESGSRNTRLDTDPVPLAVKHASDGLWYDIKIETVDPEGNPVSADEVAQRVTGIKALLRRAGQHYERGIRIDPRSYPDKVRFKTGPRRQNKKAEVAPEGEPATAPEVNMAAADESQTEATQDGYDYDAEAQAAQANNSWGYDSNAA